MFFHQPALDEFLIASISKDSSDSIDVLRRTLEKYCETNSQDDSINKMMLSELKAIVVELSKYNVPAI